MSEENKKIALSLNANRKHSDDIEGILGIIHEYKKHSSRMHSYENPYIVDDFVNFTYKDISGNRITHKPSETFIEVHKNKFKGIKFTIDQWWLNTPPSEEFTFVMVVPYALYAINKEKVKYDSTIFDNYQSNEFSPDTDSIEFKEIGETNFVILFAIITIKKNKHNAEAYEVYYCKIDPQMKITNSSPHSHGR